MADINGKESAERLRERLMQIEQWPQQYMFKFIVKNENGQVDKVVACLPKEGITTFNTSRDLHYVSVTCVAQMPSADAIMDVTLRATSIGGVISL